MFADPAHAQPLNQAGQMKKMDESRPGGNVEIDELRAHFADESGVTVGLEIALSHSLSPAISSCAEAGSQVADYINLARAVRVGVPLIHRVVFVLQVPAIHQRHHHPQSIEFSRACERVVPPLPIACFLLAFQVTLQADILDCSIRSNKVLAA